MFDSHITQQKVSINAVNGTIVKNYKKSFFVRLHLNSGLADDLLVSNPRYCNRPVVVLQMMICGEREFIAELIYEDDFKEKSDEDNICRDRSQCGRTKDY